MLDQIKEIQEKLKSQDEHCTPADDVVTNMHLRNSTATLPPQSNFQGPLHYEPARKVETEMEKMVRYERVIDTLRK